MTETLGQRIRRFRQARGMSQEELAFACQDLGGSVHQPHLVGYERDDHEPRLRTFAVLAKALGVSLDELYGAP